MTQRHDHSVRRTQHPRRNRDRTLHEMASLPGIHSLPQRRRARRPGRKNHPCHCRQLRCPQTAQRPQMDCRSSALDFHFMPTLASWLNAVEGFFSAISRRRITPRSLHIPRRSAKCDRPLYRRPQQRLSAVGMDNVRQSHLRKTRSDPCTFCLSQGTSSSRAGKRSEPAAADRGSSSMLRSLAAFLERRLPFHRDGRALRLRPELCAVLRGLGAKVERSGVEKR
jgi:hypothetical protein